MTAENKKKHDLERMHSAEGRELMAAGEELQARVQGSLSDKVREHGVLDDAQIKEWEASLDELSPRVLDRKNSGGWRRYVARGGRWVR